jgi:hypothetical protein
MSNAGPAESDTDREEASSGIRADEGAETDPGAPTPVACTEYEVLAETLMVPVSASTSTFSDPLEPPSSLSVVAAATVAL